MVDAERWSFLPPLEWLRCLSLHRVAQLCSSHRFICPQVEDVLFLTAILVAATLNFVILLQVQHRLDI
jgi:hypothetical protein